MANRTMWYFHLFYGCGINTAYRVYISWYEGFIPHVREKYRKNKDKSKILIFVNIVHGYLCRAKLLILLTFILISAKNK